MKRMQHTIDNKTTSSTKAMINRGETNISARKVGVL